MRWLNPFLLLLSSLFSISIVVASSNEKRICETQGNCIDCGDGRFSYYRCAKASDCFPQESCQNGFCCPAPITAASINSASLTTVQSFSSASLLTATDHNTNTNTNTNTILSSPRRAAPNFERNSTCPDGSTWLRNCGQDTDCIFGDEICAEGKCCSGCQQRRRQVLDELPSNDLLGVHIPQCDETGRKYRPEQCRTGFEECWCVSEYGKPLTEQKPLYPDTCVSIREQANVHNNGQVTEHQQKRHRDIDQEQGIDNNGALEHQQKRHRDIEREPLTEPSLVLSRNALTAPGISMEVRCEVIRVGQCHQGPQQEFDLAPIQQHWCSCDDDCFGRQKCCQEMNGRRCADPISASSGSHSTVHSISTSGGGGQLQCKVNEQFVSCYNPCQASCVNLNQAPCSTIQCHAGCQCLPGYVRRDADPRSVCVLRSSCSTMEQVDGAEKCTDPLKEFRTCGTACAIGCETRNVPRSVCNERCTSGCFCRIPFVLEHSNDPNSRCLLPAECPLLQQQSTSTNPGQIVAATFSAMPPPPFPVPNSFPFNGQSSITVPFNGQSSITVPGTDQSNVNGQCSDILKVYLSCGSACPPGCKNPSGSCGESRCVPGCFCRSPFILQDTNNPQSPCVHPQHCSALSIQETGACSDPRKQWSLCGGIQCAASCDTPRSSFLSNCNSPNGVCVPGCVCREPYILANGRDINSRCVLPSECQSQGQCEETKEFLACASSCPVACNNRNPQQCSPCVSGCFCRAGLMFEDGANWRTSRCVPVEQCPSVFAPLSATISGSVFNSCPSYIPGDTTNSGRPCLNDFECPTEQKCCRIPLPSSASVSFSFPIQQEPHARCVCTDPNAIWSSCGSLCPQYCRQPSVPVCSATCKPGCVCAPGYVRARNDVAAHCVLRTLCFPPSANQDAPSKQQSNTPNSNSSNPNPNSSNPNVTNSNDDGEVLATVDVIGGQRGEIRGHFRFLKDKDSDSRLLIRASILNLPIGDHALVIHQYGDISDGCTRVGPVLQMESNSGASAMLGNINLINSTEMVKMVEWRGAKSIIGRSLVVHEESAVEWALRGHDQKAPLACGTIGFSRE